MPRRIIVFAHAALLFLASLIAFLFCAGAETTLQLPAERTAGVWIVDNDGTHDVDEVAVTVRRFSEDHGAAVGFVARDAADLAMHTHVYLAAPDPDSREARWLTDGYPTFNPAFTVDVHPLEEFADIGPNGYYFVFGAAPETAAALEEALAVHGLRTDPGQSSTEPWHFFAGGHMFNLAVIALLVVASATAAGVLLASRDYAVLRLNGHSYGRILLADLAGIARLWAALLPAATVAVLALLGLYNGWGQLWFYARVALTCAALLAAAGLAVHALTLALVHATAILPALKGRVPVRGTLAAIYLVRVPVLVLALTLIGTVVATAQTVRDQRVALELYAEHGDTSHLALSPHYGWVDEEDFAALDATVGPWLRDTDRRGEMVLAIRLSPEEWSRPTAGAPGHEALVVNDTYLAEQRVTAPDGSRYGADDGVRVLLPESLAADEDAVAEDVRGWLDMVSGDAGAPPVSVLPSAAGQTLFTYGSRSSAPSRFLPRVTDPVVIALPNGGVLSDTSYANHLTGHATVFPDPAVPEAFRADHPDAARYVIAVETLTTTARQDLDVHRTILRSELFTLAGVGAVLMVTAIGACLVYVRARAQHIFVRHLSGWTFAATHRRLLLAEAGIAVAFVGWATGETFAGSAAQNDPTAYTPPGTAVTTGAEPFYALAIALASLAITAGALVHFHLRIVREGASQA
ncbi:hypothetical protein DFP74_5903 [Nocardiopsis sp. Huas11]|uniref:hypothetical protein n=1 Tax=Nocardiopsis sp. Huas11 TaxID=2183912 RepID=UPI000EB1D671|nr:hypothetical protein [Nocardiopsis sp. Huas11]RKS10149.1 hypothetical protein DFP74_5903 [Nocardiopsis sp. Huas11]